MEESAGALMEYPALTIWQPWATLIAIGAKPYEFRGWKPPKWLIGKRMAIHAGARPVKMKEVRALILSLQGAMGLQPPVLVKDIALPLLERLSLSLAANHPTLFGTGEALTLPLSCILGTAIVGEGKRGDHCAAEFGVDAGNDSDRDGTFNWGWPLTDFQHLEPPMPAKGAQGIWKWNA